VPVGGGTFDGMPRRPRREYPGALHHVIARGNRRGAIYADEADRAMFLAFLDRVVHRTHWRCHAYCLLTNHYHLLIETPVPNLALGMRMLNGRYAQAFNERHGLSGHLFQGRYNALPVERPAQLLALCRYIVLNPVRAGLCRDAGEWPWSSYRATAGLTAVPRWLTVDWLLDQLADDRPTASRRYADLVLAGIEADALVGALVA
jgi:putative transposase